MRSLPFQYYLCKCGLFSPCLFFACIITIAFISNHILTAPVNYFIMTLDVFNKFLYCLVQVEYYLNGSDGWCFLVARVVGKLAFGGFHEKPKQTLPKLNGVNYSYVQSGYV